MAGTPKQNITLPVPTKGMQSAYSHYVASPNSWSYLENFDNDELGVLTTRANIFLSGTNTTESQGVGIYSFADNLTFFVKAGVDLMQVGGQFIGAPNIIASQFTNANAVARFSQVAGIIFVATAFNFIKYWDTGTSTFVNTSMTAMGNVNDLINAGFQGRIWAASSTWQGTGESGKVYYSNVIQNNDPTTVTYNNPSFLILNTKGRPLTGLTEADNVLYCFGANSIHRIYNTQSQDNAPFIHVGAIRQEVIVKAFESIYFMHPTGVYELKNGSVNKVSQEIDNLFEKLNLSILSGGNLNGQRCHGWFDNEAVYFSIDLGYQFNLTGNVDRTYILRYNYIYKHWSVYSFKDSQITNATSGFAPISGNETAVDLQPTTLIYAKDLNSSNFKQGLFNIRTKADGSKPFVNIATSFVPQGDWSPVNGSVSTTNIVPVPCNAETQWITFGSEVSLKIINGISIASENAAGFTLMYQIDKENMEMSDRNNAKWTTVGDIKDDYITFYRDFESKPFRRIKFKISGTALGLPIKIGEITFLSISNEGYGNN